MRPNFGNSIPDNISQIGNTNPAKKQPRRSLRDGLALKIAGCSVNSQSVPTCSQFHQSGASGVLRSAGGLSV